jgi:hypothetical protein
MIATSSNDAAPVDAPSLMRSVPVALDAKGRVRVTKEQRRAILAEFERSGLSGARFAQVAGLKYSTFAGWLQRYRRPKPKGPAKPLRLLEAVMEPARSPEVATTTVLVLQLPGGVQVELGAAKQVPLAAALVRALAQPC